MEGAASSFAFPSGNLHNHFEDVGDITMKTKLTLEKVEAALNNYDLAGMCLINNLFRAGVMQELGPDILRVCGITIEAIGENPKGMGRWQWEIME
jgi:hypothetical protein